MNEKTSIPSGTRLRKDVPEDEAWNTKSLYPNEKLWDKDYQKAKKMIPGVSKYSGRLKTKKSVLSCFVFMDGLSRLVEKLYTYAHLNQDVDTTAEKYQKMMGSMMNLISSLGESAAFITPELTEQKQEFLDSLIADKKLADYKLELKKITRARKHIRSKEAEEVLAITGETRRSPSEIFSKFDNADIKLDSVIMPDDSEEDLTPGTFTKFLKDDNSDIRLQAAKNMFNYFRRHQYTIAATLASHFKTNHIMATKVRKHPSTVASFLDGDNIPEKVYQTLFQVVENSLPVFHEYVALRKKCLNLEELHWYDLYAPLFQEKTREYSYDEAVDIVIDSLFPLGTEYCKIARAGLTTLGWVDRYENKGKRGGAYSSGCYDSEPFILMNFNGTLNSVSTLTHELGHSMHSYLTCRAQPFSNMDYTIFLAEIASTVNEGLLGNFLLERADNKTKLAVLNHELENIKATLFRQTKFAMFEAALYETLDGGEVLTLDVMNEAYANLHAKFYGQELIVDDFVPFEWMRIPHFYANFYVYQYATGTSAANYFVSQILTGDKKAKDNYLGFLSDGGFNYPVNTMKKRGLDMTKPDYIEETVKIFKQKLDLFKQLRFEE